MLCLFVALDKTWRVWLIIGSSSILILPVFIALLHTIVKSNNKFQSVDETEHFINPQTINLATEKEQEK